MDLQNENILLQKIIQNLSQKIDQNEFQSVIKVTVRNHAVENYNNKLKPPICNLTITNQGVTC